MTSTTVLEDGRLQDQWIFEETFVDAKHSAAVCKEVGFENSVTICNNPLAAQTQNTIAFVLRRGT